KSAPKAAPSTNTSVSSRPTAKAVRSSNASSPISDERTSSSRCSPSSDGSSPARIVIPRTPNSAKPRTGGRSSSFGPCSISWDSGASSTDTSGRPKASPSPTAPLCSSLTGSSPRPVSTGSPAGPHPSPPARRLVPHPRSAPRGQGPDRSGALPPPPRPLQPQARPGALRHHQYLLRGRGSAGFRQAWLQPRRQVAERAGDHRHGDGRGLADRPSCLGGQPYRPFHSSRSHQ